MTRLFHVSDVHFGAEDPAAVAWFDRLVHDERPDAVVMTGDLTMRARRREFDAGGEWLRSLGVPVTLEVGNHDLPYYYSPWRRLIRPYRRYRALEDAIERPLDLPGVTIVPLKTTARAQFRIDWSKGNVSDPSLERALALIAQAPKGSLILVAAHHPLVEAGAPGTGGTRHGARALETLSAAGVSAVLTGHVHEPYDVAFRVADRTVRLIGAGTISRRVRQSPAAFNELRIEGGEIVTICRTMAGTTDPVPLEYAAGA
ncbi:MAG: metallophosphoesterase [Sphingomonas sp.]